MTHKHFIAAGIALLLLPGVAWAGTVVRTGESVTVAADQTVEDDFYAAGGTVSMSGTVRGDMYTAGGSVTVNGVIEADLTILGGSAQVHATVSDDVRIVGGEAVIAEAVGGDVFVIGGLLKVLSSAEIAGDVYFFGGEAEISGPVGGSVMGTAETIRIDSAIAGGVDVVTAQQLTLGERASVTGDVTYRSRNEIERSQNAVVTGTVVRNTVAPVANEVDVQQLLTPLFVMLFGVLLLYLFGRQHLHRFATTTAADFGRSGLIGLAVMFGSPLVILLAFISILGIAVGLLGLFMIGLLYVLSLLLMGVVAGALLARVCTKAYDVSLLWIMLGVTLVYALIFIPILGPFLFLVLFAITLGSLALSLYRAV